MPFLETKERGNGCEYVILCIGKREDAEENRKLRKDAYFFTMSKK